MYIETDRLIIRNFTSEDIELICEINNHPECIRFNGWDSMSLTECENVLNKWIQGYIEHPKYGVFCITTKDYIGVGMGFIMKYENSNDFEVGFRLRRNAWENGYATEITREFINYASEELNAHNVCAEVDSNNERSLKIFRKLGFEEYVHPAGEGGKMFKYRLEGA